MVVKLSKLLTKHCVLRTNRNIKRSMYCQYIKIVKSNVSSVIGLSSERNCFQRSNVRPWLVMDSNGLLSMQLDYTIRIGSTPTFLYFDLYLYSVYAVHYVYFFIFKLLTIVLLHFAVPHPPCIYIYIYCSSNTTSWCMHTRKANETWLFALLQPLLATCLTLRK